jgi:hypothetical protein
MKQGVVVQIGALASFQRISPRLADAMLVRWAHRLGPCRRPFGRQAFALYVAADPVSVAVSASVVSSTVAGYRRDEVVELARLCTAPGQAWASRVMLRLWREVAARGWPHWPVRVAVSYSQNAHHKGHLYRLDGWERVTTTAGSHGGGTWSTRRDQSDPAYGSKTLWIWRYNDVEQPSSPVELPDKPHNFDGAHLAVKEAA